MKQKMKYYKLDRILMHDALYNVIFGERSNGKTYACLEYGIKRHFKDGSQMAIIRRWDTDFQKGRAKTYFDNLVLNGVVTKYSKGKYSTIIYRNSQWFFANYDDKLEKYITAPEPFCYAFAITSAEHYKMNSYPRVETIVFDEFLTRDAYLPDEFVDFSSIISTIVRNRNTPRIFMLGNTVNKYSPYFEEMGLKHIKELKKGDIQTYMAGDELVLVAVEYADGISKTGVDSDPYFAFDNPHLKMITTGEWETAMYPHLPEKYTSDQILFKYFIEFDSNRLQCEIIDGEQGLFTYIHRKTTEINHPEEQLIYTMKYNIGQNYSRRITHPKTTLEAKVLWFFVNDKVYFQDNEVGEVVRNYINWSKKESLW